MRDTRALLTFSATRPPRAATQPGQPVLPAGGERGVPADPYAVIRTALTAQLNELVPPLPPATGPGAAEPLGWPGLAEPLPLLMFATDEVTTVREKV